MDDLVKRLRSVPPCNGCGEYPGGDIAQIMDIAADRIAALEAQVRAADALAEQVQRVKDFRYDPNIGIELNRLEESLTAYRATKEGGA